MLSKRTKKALPIGVSQFKEVITEDYYYIDKTMLVHELCSQNAKVTLFTRPRRFGKTLNMSMLKEFFDITKDSKELFRGLNIEKSSYIKEMNQYPTLFFSFRESKGEKEFLLFDMFQNIREEFRKYAFLIDTLDEFKQEEYREILEILNRNKIEHTAFIGKSLRFLTEVLCNHYQKPVVLLIDEYDTPMENAYVEGYYQELRSFFRMLYASVLKDNPYLKMGVLTGIQRISKENIFSGLNNLEVNTVKSNCCGEYFGLTIPETQRVLEYYELSLTEEVTAAYDGYNFGGYEIYNPWSILNYAKTKSLQAFWVNTASNTMIKNSILKSDVEFKEAFETLITKGRVRVHIDMDTAYSETVNTATLWGLLLNAGYITLVDTNGTMEREVEEIRIPNIEVKTEFRRIVLS